MGAWGAGNFENDDALDFLGALEETELESALQQAFAAVEDDAGRELDATDSARALAAAELIAAARGHASEDLPDEAGGFAAKLKASEGLAQAACHAVSRVLLSSELLALWAESDEAENWNRVITGLIGRLSKPARKSKSRVKPKNKLTACECSFCLERVPEDELVDMSLSMSMVPGTTARTIFAHAACLNARLHPSRIVQWWRFES